MLLRRSPSVDASYYGYRDEEDDVLTRLEGPTKEAMRREATKEEMRWEAAKEWRREARKGVVKVTAVAREVLKEDEEEVVEEERARDREENKNSLRMVWSCEKINKGSSKKTIMQ